MGTYSALDVAAEIRKRLPGVPTKKLHKLLYYCQGYHAAAFGSALFAESIEAWDMGPVVAALWRDEKHGSLFTGTPAQALGQAELNTVGYVLSRYGAMTGADLESLTHHEPPWMLANQRRQLTGEQQMEVAEISAYFQHAKPVDEADDDDEYQPASDAVRAWLADAPIRQQDTLTRDDLTLLRALAQP